MSQPRKLPLAQQSFRQIIEGGYCYVDKTQLAYELIESGKYYLLSRPRGFGKSLFLDVIQSIFTGEQELFAGLAAERQVDWRFTWPLIRFNFAKLPDNSVATWSRICHQQVQAFEARYDIACNASDLSLRLAECIGKLHRKTGRRVVVLVDDYDGPAIAQIKQGESARALSDFMKALYSPLKSEDAHLEFVLLAGETRMYLADMLGGGANHLCHIGMLPEVATICGFTEDELRHTFADQALAERLPDIMRYYGGYRWAGEAVCNPHSVLRFMAGRQFQDYWIGQDNPAWVGGYVEKVGLGEQYPFRIGDFDQPLDVDGLAAYPLLFHCGYISVQSQVQWYGEHRYTLDWPNQEVAGWMAAHGLDKLVRRAGLD